MKFGNKKDFWREFFGFYIWEGNLAIEGEPKEVDSVSDLI